MAIKIGKIKETQASAFLHTCEICGVIAPFGKDVSFRKALSSIARGNYAAAKELLGKWYCLKHWREYENN